MRRLGAVGLLVAAASAVVAIGATGVGLLLPPANLNGGWALAARVAGAVAVIAGSAGLLVQRKRLRSNADRHYDPTAAALVAAATIMGVLALMARFAPAASVGEAPIQEDSEIAQGFVDDDEQEPKAGPPRPSYGGISGGLGLAREGPDRRIPRQSEDRGDDGSGRSVLRQARGFILLAALFAVAVIGVLALRGRPGRQPRDPPPDVQVAAEDAEAALEASLVDVAYEGKDPRRQITTAYQRLLAALAAAGAPRQPQEAPHEHLHRTLGPLGVQPEPMHSLTELYVVAQFSERPVTEEHRAAATGALEAGLVSLRSAKDGPEADGTGAIPDVPETAHA